MTAPSLAARGVSVGYGGGPVVRNLDLDVRAGEMTVLLGPNGAGKTTSLLALSGALRVMAGSIELDGVASHDPAWKRARHGVAHIDAERAVIRGLSVWDNLRMATRTPERAFDLFPELSAHKRRTTGLLSGGQQRMLGVAMALCTAPKVLLADELSLGLAPLLVQRLLQTLRAAADGGLAVLLVEQHARQALDVADRGVVLARGSVVRSGTGAEILRDIDQIAGSYLGAPGAPTGPGSSAPSAAPPEKEDHS